MEPVLHWLESVGRGVAATKATKVATMRATLENIVYERITKVGLVENVGFASRQLEKTCEVVGVG
jgi:hypothetical protein